MKKVIVTVTNDLTVDNRMHKVCETLMLNGYDVTLLGRKLPNSAPIKRPYKIKRLKLIFNKGFLFYAEYNIRLFFYLLVRKYDLFYAVDLDTILPHIVISKLKNKPLLYDAHEYFPEVPEVVNRKKIKKIWEKIEKFSIPKANEVITVSNGIAEIFYNKYHVNAFVVRNVPKSYTCKTLKSESPVILYQGSVNVHRGIEYLVQAMKYLPENVTLWIIGDGDVFEVIQSLVEIEQVSDRVKLMSKIPFEELPKYTCKAWVGVSIEENIGKSYRLALPNKLFDYIQAGVPVLVSNLPEMKKIVEHYQVGEILSNHQPHQIAEILNDMLFNLSKRKQYAENLTIAKKELTWENEQKILLNVLSRIN
jgi:glycosyltransferase involved in cell wall biosynthesis